VKASSKGQSNENMDDKSCGDTSLAIAGAHVNAPGFGYVVRKGAGFAFEPAS
jgi:hypothetical protein